MPKIISVGDHVLGLQRIIWQSATTPPTTAEVEEHDVMITSQRLEPGEQVAVSDIRPAVQHQQRPLPGAAYTHLTDEDRHLVQPYPGLVAHELTVPDPALEWRPNTVCFGNPPSTRSCLFRPTRAGPEVCSGIRFRAASAAVCRKESSWTTHSGSTLVERPGC